MTKDKRIRVIKNGIKERRNRKCLISILILILLLILGSIIYKIYDDSHYDPIYIDPIERPKNIMVC